MKTDPSTLVGRMIRGTHPYAYRSGEWGVVKMVVPARGRDCFLIEWPDGATDIWVCDDAADPYEFRAANPLEEPDD